MVLHPAAFVPRCNGEPLANHGEQAMTRQQILKHVDQRQPSANDLLRGWHDAEMGVDYQRDETDDWRTGWTLWHHQHGGQISSSAWH